jgi:hypothetical protein
MLQTLKVLIIPDANVFDPADVPRLQTWVTNGGCLIVTGDSGSRLGESGNFAATNKFVLAPLTAVTNVNLPPVMRTNFLGLGAVYYFAHNVGLAYYMAAAAGRAEQLSVFAKALSNAFGFLNVQPALHSSNAPATVGLTLYQDSVARKTFVDMNNFNVDANTFVTTPTPEVDVDLARPAWLTNGVTIKATEVSPDGSPSVKILNVDASRVYLRLPSVTNYLSVILQP